jgi:4-carboxymuconolactone decarboxylase
MHSWIRCNWKYSAAIAEQGENKMKLTDQAKQYHEKMFPGYVSDFLRTDPEFIPFFDNFAFDETVNEEGQQLADAIRFKVILAVLIGSQSQLEFKCMIPAALHFGVAPVEIKEIVYQAVAYLGIGRVIPFLVDTNEVLTSEGIELPLPPQGTVIQEDRLALGEKAQVEIIGERMKGFASSGDPDEVHIHKWLVDNCFGDYYTRNGLSHAERELMTFCYLYAQGGCESQLISHTMTNIRLGNDRKFLIKVISNCIPFIGYPRSLNALRCVNEADQKTKGK